MVAWRCRGWFIDGRESHSHEVESKRKTSFELVAASMQPPLTTKPLETAQAELAVLF
jgi:hypothetical protein